MAGLFKKAKNFFLGVRNNDYDTEGGYAYYETDYNEQDDEYDRPVYTDIQDISPRRGRGSKQALRRAESNIVDLHKRSEVNICIPKNIEDARDVIDNTKDGIISVVNLEGVDSAIAQRIADFLSGSVDALEGNIRRLSNDMFVITPNGIDVTGEFYSELDSRLERSGITMPWTASTAYS